MSESENLSESKNPTISENDDPHSLNPIVDRRDLLKLGAVAVVAAMAAPMPYGQETNFESYDGGRADTRTPLAAPGLPPTPGQWRPHTGPGYQNTFGRLGENGPIDDVTRQIVEYVHGFKESDISPSALKAVNRTMVDSLAACIAGFEEEAVRIAARAARLSPPGPQSCTVMGYGFSSTPELASFVNSCMVRLVDFNDTPHTSNLIPAALAIGEATHSTGSQVLAAIVLAFETSTVGGAGESVPPAMAAGKLMGLDQDRLANAVTLALTPHVALSKGVGAMSMWKGCRSAEAVKCGVWGAILAQLGMTGPPQPFEGRGGYWYLDGHIGRPFKLPAQSQLAIERTVNKRFPSDQMTQQMLALIPEMRAWTKYDEIAAIEFYLPFGNWEECGDAPKWDPRNRDTADHSIPYLLARNLISGGPSYLNYFAPDQYPYRDPVVKALIDKITLTPVKEWGGNGANRIVIRKISGEEKYWDTFNGNRDPGGMENYPQMSDQDITDKFKKVCAYRHVEDAQRDKLLEYFWNFSAVQDVAVPMRALASFGRPQPL